MQVIGKIGGPGRTRTCNQTVMSGQKAFMMQAKSIVCAILSPFIGGIFGGVLAQKVASRGVEIVTCRFSPPGQNGDQNDRR